MKHNGTRPSGSPTPGRKTPRFMIGDTLRTHHDFVGYVDAIYGDVWAAIDSGVIGLDWPVVQEKPPSSLDQIFYSLVALNGLGAVLVGEAEAEAVA